MSVFESKTTPGGLTVVMDKESIGESIGIRVRERVSSQLQFTLFAPIVCLTLAQSSRAASHRVDNQLFSTWNQYVQVRLAIEEQSKEAYDDQASQ